MTQRRLSVAVHGRPVAELIEHDAGRGGYALEYLTHARADDFVCLSLRELKVHADFQEVPAIFQQFLPEGALRVWVEEVFAKSLGIATEFDLVGVVGPHVRGRVSILGPGSQDEARKLDLTTLLSERGTGDLFRTYLDTLGLSGVAVSGVHPKVVAAADNRVTATFESVIVKFQPRAGTNAGASAGEWPGLAINEYFCLEAARRGGLRTANARLSDDGERLVIERFDLPVGGTALGFEDACTLEELAPHHKYHGDYESVFRALLSWTRGPRRIAARQTLFDLLTLNCLIGNGDAHRKNHAVLYSGLDDIEIAPVYDLVSTLVYQHADLPALALRQAETRRAWPDRAALARFGKEALQLEPRTVRESLSRMLQAVSETAAVFEQYARNGPPAATLLLRGDRSVQSLPGLWSERCKEYSAASP